MAAQPRGRQVCPRRELWRNGLRCGQSCQRHFAPGAAGVGGVAGRSPLEWGARDKAAVGLAPGKTFSPSTFLQCA